jgi:hypothetical protein
LTFGPLLSTLLSLYPTELSRAALLFKLLALPLLAPAFDMNYLLKRMALLFPPIVFFPPKFRFELLAA